jgi:hypothetical protein
LLGSWKFKNQVRTGIVSLGFPVNSIPPQLKPFISNAAKSGEYNPAEVAIIVASQISGAFQVLVDDVIVSWKQTERIDTFKPAVGEALQKLGHSKFSHVPGF